MQTLLEFTLILAKKGIFNTDLKPENVVLYREFYLFIKLIDIGGCSFDYKKFTVMSPFYFN